MPDPANVTVMPDPLREFVGSIFIAHGVPPRDAAIIADHLVEADLRGVYSHGVIRVEPYTNRYKAGAMNPKPNVRVLRETVSTALVDGDDGAGQVVGVQAMKIAIEKAKRTGVAWVGVRHSNHLGTCAYYALMAIEHDMIGIAATPGATRIMAPWGGITKLLGNNPFGVALPAGKEYPVVLDMAQSVVARGKIAHAAKTGTPIPSTWALNKHGEPTTDPVEAYAGLVQPVGGYKGYGMAFVVMALGAILNGAAFVHSVPVFENGIMPNLNVGHFFQVVDIKAFMDPSEFKARMDEAIQAMHASELARGNDRVYVPGEIEWLKREERLKQGVPIAVGVWKDLVRIAEEVGVALPPTNR
ncbi:MAG: Ldh family oxidoreductase [Sphingomonadaceae bacterium]